MGPYVKTCERAGVDAGVPAVEFERHRPVSNVEQRRFRVAAATT
jgi:hypothetical protein